MVQSHTQGPATVTSEQAVWYTTYEPRKLEESVWKDIAPVHANIMLRTSFDSLLNFKGRCNDVVRYLAWRHATAKELTLEAAMTVHAITDYHRNGPLSTRDRNVGESLSRLKTIARQVNPLVLLEEPPTFAGKAPLQPPYEPVEEAHIRRVSLRQRLPRSRQRLCAMVGLAAGAGLRPTEMRLVRDRHIRKPDNLYIVSIKGPFAREVPVYGPYNELIEVGLTGVQRGHKLLAPHTEHKTLTAKIVENAEILGNVPHISARRLRNTWLTHMLSRPIPMVHILTLAGLETARNLVDLIPYTTADDLDIEMAAGVTK